MSTLGIGLIFDLFHEIGQVCVRRDKFQIWLRIGVKISACSFRTQNAMPSGPVAVRLMLLRLFQTSLLGISGTSISLPTATSTDAIQFKSYTVHENNHSTGWQKYYLIQQGWSGCDVAWCRLRFSTNHHFPQESFKQDSYSWSSISVLHVTSLQTISCFLWLV